MKKKYYYPSILITVFAFLLCSLTTNAQTTVFSEDFNSIMPGMSITKATSDLTLYGLSPLMRYSQVNNGRFRAGDAVSNTSKCNSTYGPTASLGGYIILDCSANGTYSANVLTIGPLSMAAYQGGSAEMTFYCADIGDEFHYNYTWGIYKMDQVAISYDGGSTFYFVQTSGGTGYSGNTKGTDAWINPVKAGLSAANQYFTQYTFSISAHAAAFGQTLNDNIVIQLAQYDNYKSTSCTASDGLGFDDIVITGTAAGGPPATPGTITGSATPYASWVGETYSITAVGGADSYAWTVPSGWSITSGQGHTSITVTTGTGNGNISVTATNNHGISAASTLAVAPIPGATLPYTATFDNEATHSGTAGVQGFTFATPGWTNVTNGSGDDIDWRIYTGSTGSGNTGPTTGDGGSGKYMYIESSSPNYNVAAILISRAIDLSSYAAADLSFAYHMYGAAIGTMVVDVSSNGGSTWTTEWTMSGNQGNAWANATVSLNSYAGSLIYIRIKGTTGSTFTSDFAIDSWSVEEGCSFSVGSLSSGSPESLSSITATTTIGLTGQSSSASIQWQNTTGGGSSWSNCNNSSATSSSYTTGWIGKDMDYRAALRVGSEACYSSTYSLTQSNAGHVWTGGNNYIYHTASNWSEASLPTASTSVYIGTENYGSAPSITTTASYANDLEIQAGATLGNIAASGGGLTVSGSVNVAGTITNNGAGAIKVTGGSISGGTKVEAGAHASDYTYTFTRGYYFQAQSSFTISGVHASDGNTAGSAANSQSVEIVDFGTSPPLEYTNSSGSHTVLYSGIDAGTGWLTCNVSIVSGNYYGVIGAKHTTGTTSMYNSYGGASQSFTFDGNATPVRRLLLQTSLASGSPASGSYMGEGNGSIGRVDIQIGSTSTTFNTFTVASGGDVTALKLKKTTTETIEAGSDITLSSLNVSAGTFDVNGYTITADEVIIGPGVTIDIGTGTLAVSGSTFDYTNGGVSNGTVEFGGSTPMSITSGGNTIGSIVMNNSGGITLNDDVIVSSSGTVALTSGVISTGSNTLIVTNTAAAAMTGGSNTAFVFGKLRRHFVANSSTYEFHIGQGTSTTDYNRADLLNNSLELASATDYLEMSAGNITESGNNIDANLYTYQNTTKIVKFYEAAVWKLTPSNSGSFTSGNYGLRLYTANISGLIDNQFTILKRPTGSSNYSAWNTWDGITSIPASGQAGRTVGSGFAEKTLFNSFSEGGIGGGSGAELPIELVDFAADVSDEDLIDLSWTTASEINNDFFTIERSRDAVDFDIMVTVPGAGNSNEMLYYEAEDTDPMLGVSYYRLKQTDYDGQHSYSKIVSVKNLKELNFSVMPNPTTERLTITFGRVEGNTVFVMTPEYKADIKIFNTAGKLVYKKKFDGTFYKFTINVMKLPEGMYYVNLKANDELYKTSFLKQ